MTIEEVIVERARDADRGWGSAYPFFASVIRKRNYAVGAEIGVAFGGHAEYLLQNSAVELLYGVDPYRHDMNYRDPMNLPQADFDALFSFTTKRMAPFGGRFKLIRTYSNEAVNEIQGNLDFVYIDAIHSYDGVWLDLCAWYPKVRYGGIIGGHDYDHPDFPGVKAAVDGFFARLGYSIHAEGEGVWWTEKVRINVSFIIPAYNCSKTIAASIESIMDRNAEEGDEIVVCDDRSTDDTAAVIAAMQNKYSAVRTVGHTRNKGGGSARNTAVEHAKNDLVFCLDSDNILAPGSVPKLKSFLIDSGADAAAFQELRFFSEAVASISHKWIFREGRTTLADHLAGHVVPGASGNYLFTKNSWARAGGYPEFAGALDAWGFGLRQLATGSCMMVMPGTFYYHRCGHESYWVRESEKGHMSLIALQLVIPFIDLIDKKDIDYIMSPGARYSWFERLERRPIMLRSGLFGKNGRVELLLQEPANDTRAHRIAGRLRNILKNLRT